MMLLKDAEYKQLLKVNMSLFYFAGMYEELLDGDMTFNNFLHHATMGQLGTCKDALFSSPEIMEKFVALNKQVLSKEECAIIKDYRRFIGGEFILYQCTKDYGVFIHARSEKVYAVKALTEPFTDMVPALPAIVETTLMPFMGKIVYDGFLSVINVPGKAERPELMSICEEVVGRSTIIVKL